MQHNIDTLVLEGGGVCGIAYLGFFKEVERAGALEFTKINKFGGVSSGALAALFLALGYTLTEMFEYIAKIDFKQLNPAPNQNLIHLFDKSYFENEYLFQLINDIIAGKTGKTNVTFKDLYTNNNYKDLSVFTIKLTSRNGFAHKEFFVFSYERTPNAGIAEAIRASMALPFTFPPIRLLQTKGNVFEIDAHGDLFIDGGIIDCAPLNYFDKIFPYGSNNLSVNASALNLVLDPYLDPLSEEDGSTETAHTINTNLAYANAVLDVVRRNDLVDIKTKRDPLRTVFIDTLKISPTKFSLSEQEQCALIESGSNAAKNWLKKLKQGTFYA